MVAAGGMVGGSPNKPSGLQAGLTDLHLEVVEGVLVDVLHLVHQLHGEVSQSFDVGLAHLVICGVVEARGGHVGAADGLDLFQLPEPILTDDLDRWRTNWVTPKVGTEVCREVQQHGPSCRLSSHRGPISVTNSVQSPGAPQQSGLLQHLPCGCLVAVGYL